MSVFIIEGPDGAGKTTLINALKAASDSVETIHPGKPAESYEALLAMLNAQFTYKSKNPIIYDRQTCLSEWIYRPFRKDVKKDPENEYAVYFSLMEAHFLLSTQADMTIIYCRPPEEIILQFANLYTEYDTDETRKVVEDHIHHIIIAYDVLMERLKRYGCKIVVYDYTKHDIQDLVKAILE